MPLSCRSFRTIAVLVISGKQPSSWLLLYLCVLAKVSATVVLFNIFSTSRKNFVFQAIFWHRAITSTIVVGTAAQTTVPGYHTLSITGYEPRVCEWGPAAAASLLLSPSAVESTPVLQDLQFFNPPAFGYFFSFFRWELLPKSAFCWRPHGVNALITGPGLITWALGCTFVTLLVL